MDKDIHPTKRMWRTLVRVLAKHSSGEEVILAIPGRNAHAKYSCPRQAIPPVIWDTMEEGRRYHVTCNIGCDGDSDLCFDGWEKD